MPVNLTNMDIGTRYALQEDFDNGFVGRDRQVVIQTDDPKGYRPVIMDGQTTGGKSKVALVADLTDYATKTELNGKANATHSHAISDVTNLQTTIDSIQSTINTKVNKTGGRGQLAGYETASQSVTTVNQDSPDAGFVSTSVTLSNGGNNTSWIKCYKIETATLNVSLGGSWVWANGETPEIAQYDFLVCAWVGNGGIAYVVKRSA